ncbi:MAG: sensor domain-containing diguanylate cyclase [Candidatus Marinimicrobia bacterium]|nr:sensor domain-containing diguanylate cyclase [Candidatus Neomarinimicrobiota bacterium]
MTTAPDIIDFEIMLQTLKFATRQIVSELDRDQLAFQALDVMADFSQTNRLSIFILDDLKETALLIGSLDRGRFDLTPLSIKISDSPFHEVLENKHLGIYEPESDDSAVRPAYTTVDHPEKCFCLPLIGTKNKVLGFVCFAKSLENPLQKIQQEILTVLTTMIATALENAMLFHLATLDGLTGLYVRRYFDIRLQEELARLKRADGDLAILITDIDHFKTFNDTYGHQQGDIVLQELAQIFKQTARKDLDIACRYGGEEFVVILPATNLEGAIVFGERLRSRCEAHPYPGQDKPLRVTISGGIAAINSKNLVSREELIKIADQHLYEAKESGRNKIRF